MKFLGLMVIGVLLTGCASSDMIPVDIESTPPGAQIDVNGASFGPTPVRVQLACSKRWVGVANAPGGWAYDRAVYEVTANPAQDIPGMTQTKSINACEIKSPPAHMRFDMAIEKVAPRQRVDMTVSSPTGGLDATLKSLKSLRDQGLLSDQEYRSKIDQAIGGK